MAILDVSVKNRSAFGALKVKLERGTNSEERFQMLLDVGMTEEGALHCFTDFLEHEAQMMQDVCSIAKRWQGKQLDAYGALELIETIMKKDHK